MAATLLLAGALLTQSATLPALPQGDQSLRAGGHGVSVARETTDNRPITASARMRRGNDWLTTSGPDAAGQYRVWVKVADLDLATDAGFSRMNSRVNWATSVLCDISAEQPQIPGFYNRGARECWRNTLEQASDQMQSARDAARQGKPVAVLGLANNH